MHPLSPRKTPICFAVALLVGCLLALCLSGCAGGGTRFIESVGLQGTVTQEVTGETTGTGGFTIQFRDGRDAKTIRRPKVSLRESAIEAIGNTVDLTRREYFLNPADAPFPLVVPSDPLASLEQR